MSRHADRRCRCCVLHRGARYSRRARCHGGRPSGATSATPLDGEYDVLICGASFAGLAGRARAGRIGRATSASSTATRSASARRRPARRRPSGSRRWGSTDSMRQTFDTLVVHTPHDDGRLPAALDLLDLRLPRAVRAAVRRSATPSSRPPRSTARHARTATARSQSTDRGRRCQRPARRRRARLAAGARRRRATSRPTRRSRAGSRCIPDGGGDELEIWIDRGYVPAGYGWSFPAARRGADRRRLLRPALPRQGADRAARRGPRRARPSATRATGSRTSCAPGPPRATSSSSATPPAMTCLPLTAEGIRTAFYFGIACGNELRRRRRGSRHRSSAALERYAAFSARHDFHFRWLLRVQAGSRVSRRALLAPALDYSMASEALHPLGVRSLPARSPRRPTPVRSADDEKRPGQKQGDAQHPLAA